MEKSSSKKHILAGVIILVIVGVAFFLGWFTGTNVPLYTTESSTSETVDSIPVLDKIGSGNPVHDMNVDFDRHMNTGELPKCFEEADIDIFIDNLNDWV